MNIEIFDLTVENGKHKPDLLKRVASIAIKDGIGNFIFYDPSREKIIRKLFDGPAVVFGEGTETIDGTHTDSATTYPAWSREAIEHVLNNKLIGFNLGGQIT